MGELLRQYGPAALAWALFVSRRPHHDRARQCVRWLLLGLAISLTALTSEVYQLVGELTGIHHLARLISHGGMLFTAWAAQEFLTHINGLGRGSRWHLWWIAGAFTMMCLLFALAPDLRSRTPGVFEYCVVYLAGQAPALGSVIRLGLRYARLADDLPLRIGMRLIVAGAAGALAYLTNKAVRAASGRYDFPYDLDDTLLVSKALPASAHLLVLAGVALPALARWLHRYLLYQRLGPLWRALYHAEPAIALDPPRAPDRLQFTQLQLRLYRRVIEIRDGLLALQPYREHHIATAARQHATRAGMNGQQQEAAIEAAIITAALRSHHTGTPPTTPQAPLTEAPTSTATPPSSAK